MCVQAEAIRVPYYPHPLIMYCITVSVLCLSSTKGPPQRDMIHYQCSWLIPTCRCFFRLESRSRWVSEYAVSEWTQQLRT